MIDRLEQGNWIYLTVHEEHILLTSRAFHDGYLCIVDE